MVRTGESDISLVGSAPQYLEWNSTPCWWWWRRACTRFVPEDNPLSARKELELSDLDGQPFVTFGKRNHLHRYFVEARGGRRASRYPHDHVRTPNYSSEAPRNSMRCISGFHPTCSTTGRRGEHQQHRRAACQCVRYLRHKTQGSATRRRHGFLAVPGFAVNEKTPPHGRGRDSSRCLRAIPQQPAETARSTRGRRSPDRGRTRPSHRSRTASCG